MKAHWSDKVAKLGACREALDWLRTQPDPETAWRECRRGDWMLWLLGRTGADHRTLVRAACDCAEVAWDYVEPPMASILAVHVAREWCEGREDAACVANAASAASAAAYAADCYSDVEGGVAYDGAAYDGTAYDGSDAAVAYAAYAAADAACVANAACAADTYADTYVTTYVTIYAVRAVGYAADAAADARDEASARCADLIRVRFPALPVVPWHLVGVL